VEATELETQNQNNKEKGKEMKNAAIVRRDKSGMFYICPECDAGGVLRKDLAENTGVEFTLESCQKHRAGNVIERRRQLPLRLREVKREQQLELGLPRLTLY
jgi:hypothetical protein